MFGKRILITDHDDWPVADVVAGYRSQSEIEFGVRQLKDPHEGSFSPMRHWTENNSAVHTFACVLALQLAHLLRLKGHRAGHDLSVRAILDTLGGIGETVLIYPSTGGRPKARRMTTEMSGDQHTLHYLSTSADGHQQRLRSYGQPSVMPTLTCNAINHDQLI